MHDDSSLQAMCDTASVGADDFVLEIDQDSGRLLKNSLRAREVIAVEFDAELARDLPKRVQAQNVSVVRQDILRFDLTALPPDYKVIANIPYYLTSNLVRVLSESSNMPQSATLLVQKRLLSA